LTGIVYPFLDFLALGRSAEWYPGLLDKVLRFVREEQDLASATDVNRHY